MDRPVSSMHLSNGMFNCEYVYVPLQHSTDLTTSLHTQHLIKYLSHSSLTKTLLIRALFSHSHGYRFYSHLPSNGVDQTVPLQQCLPSALLLPSRAQLHNSFLPTWL